MNPNLLIGTHFSTEALVLLSQIHWALPSPKAVTSFIDINVFHALVFYKRTEYLFIDQKTIVWRIFHEEREGNNNWHNESGNQSSRLIIKSNETKKKKWYKTNHNFLIGREMLFESSTWNNLQIIPMRQICSWRFLISFIVKKNYCKVVIIWESNTKVMMRGCWILCFPGICVLVVELPRMLSPDLPPNGPINLKSAYSDCQA